MIEETRWFVWIETTNMIENDFYDDTTLHSTYCCQIITIIMSVGLLHCILRLPREIKINIIGRPRKRSIHWWQPRESLPVPTVITVSALLTADSTRWQIWAHFPTQPTRTNSSGFSWFVYNLILPIYTFTSYVIYTNNTNTMIEKIFGQNSSSYPVSYLVWPHRSANHPVGPRAYRISSWKKPTLVCLSLTSLPLKALTLGASTISWSKLFQRPIPPVWEKLLNVPNTLWLL